MPARVIDFAQWKASHPPILICWQHGLACAVAWHRAWLGILSMSSKNARRYLPGSTGRQSGD